MNPYMENFVTTYERTRAATNAVFTVVPPDAIDWTYKEGKFTIGDLMRHIAAIERHVFMEIAQGNQSTYKGCGKELADGYEEILQYVSAMHHQTLAILRSIDDAAAKRSVTLLNGKQTSLDRLLQALVVHEIHHRGALCIYLNMLNVQTPAILGFTEEQVINASI